MDNFIKQFKVNKSPKLSDAIEVLFDFIVVALVSLIFNGFIINNHSSVFDQKFLMVANALLLSTHWYSYNFFRQRYEKKNSFFRILTLLSVLSLAVMATGIDLMVFRENSRISNPEAYNYLRWVAPLILVSGFLASRILIAFKFSLATYANKENSALFKLTFWKGVARVVESLVAVIHIILIAKGYSVAITTYIFFPLYFFIELFGNIANVKDKYLREAPNVSLTYVKERYSKLNLLYIASFFISGTSQFAFYFKTSSDLYMIPRLIMVYLVAFMIWWAYMDRMHRFSIKQNTHNLKVVAIANKFIVASLAIVGGLIINANKDTYLYFIIPSVFISLSVFLLAILTNMSTFIIKEKDDCITKDVKKKFVQQTLPLVVLFTTVGVISIFFSFSVWVLYGIIIGGLLLLNIGSRYTINRYIKSPKV